MLRSPRHKMIPEAPRQKDVALPAVYINPRALSSWRMVGAPVVNDIPVLPDLGAFEALALVVQRGRKLEIIATFPAVHDAQRYLAKSRGRVRAAMQGEYPESGAQTLAAWYTPSEPV